MSSHFGSSQQQPAAPNSTGSFGSWASTSSGSVVGTPSTITPSPSPSAINQPSTTVSHPHGSLFGTGTGGSMSSMPSVANSTDAPSTFLAPFSPFVEKEGNNPTHRNSYQSILFQDCYKRWSADELRLTDYNQGRRFGMTTGSTSAGSGFGGSTSGGLFGGDGLGSSSGAGGATSAFGTSSSTAPRTTGLFGSTPPTGQTPATSAGNGFGGITSGGLFGGSGLGSSSATGAATSVFGSNSSIAPRTTGLFGSTPSLNQAQALGTGPFDTSQSTPAPTPATSYGRFGTDSTTLPSVRFGSIPPGTYTYLNLSGTSVTNPVSELPSIGQENQTLPNRTATGENIVAQPLRATSSLPLHPPKPRAKKDDVEWLSEHYFGTTPVAVRCGSDDKTYVFPKEVLTQHFEFFRNELQNDENASDGAAPKGAPGVHLPDITAAAFACLVRWTQAGKSDREDAANPPDGDHTIDQLLDEIVAASYLGLDSIDELEKHICCIISTILLKDRRKLTTEHIKRTETHDAFKHVTNGGGVAWVFCKAGVRPLLQMTMLPRSTTPFVAPFTQPGHAQLEEWLAIVRHCRQLREDNETYATSVMRLAMEHLAKCGRWSDGRPAFLDPLDDDAMKKLRSLGFATEFTM